MLSRKTWTPSEDDSETSFFNEAQISHFSSKTSQMPIIEDLLILKLISNHLKPKKMRYFKQFRKSSWDEKYFHA